MWTRDIKLSTNIPQHTLTKTLKILEQRNLIKSVRSVVSKSKKLYMLYDIVPAKEITGALCTFVTVVYCGALCCVVFCCVVLCYAVLCCAVL